jgi:hypothetical protein
MEEQSHRYRVTLTQGTYDVTSEKTLDDYTKSMRSGMYRIITGNREESIPVSATNLIRIEEIEENTPRVQYKPNIGSGRRQQLPSSIPTSVTEAVLYPIGIEGNESRDEEASNN